MRGGKVATWGSVGPTGGGQASGGGGGGGGVRNPSRYNFGTVAKVHEDVSLNGGYPRAMRAPGHPQAMFAIELMMDHLAETIGMDPLEFRLLERNERRAQEMLKVGAELIGWSEIARRAASRRARSSAGSASASAIGATAAAGPRSASTSIATARSKCVSGAQDIGMGYRTMIGDVVRTHLGLPRELLVVKVGRGDYPPGPASGGSVTSRATAPKAFVAADMAKDGMRKLVAKEWGLDDPTGVKLENGVFNGRRQIDGMGQGLPADDGRSAVRSPTNEDGDYWKKPTRQRGRAVCRRERRHRDRHRPVNKVVALQNVGLPVNRNTIENQITGAVIQGLSFCLFEDRILNRQTGAMVNPNMDMYKIAGPLDVPEIVPVIWREDRDVGVNSLGEPPVVPTPGAIATAVANAIGVQVRSMPLTPDKVLAAAAPQKGQVHA